MYPKLHYSKMDKKTLKKQNRIFSEKFRREKVQMLDEKVLTISELCKEYQISETTVYRWLKLYSNHYQKGTKMVVEQESEAQKTKELLLENQKLKAIIGEKQMEIDVLNKVIEISSQELGVDLKKNSLLK